MVVRLEAGFDYGGRLSDCKGGAVGVGGGSFSIFFSFLFCLLSDKLIQVQLFKQQTRDNESIIS